MQILTKQIKMDDSSWNEVITRVILQNAKAELTYQIEMEMYCRFKV